MTLLRLSLFLVSLTFSWLPTPLRADEPEWVMEEVRTFPGGSARLTAGGDGNVYGTEIRAFESGSIFRIDAAGRYSTLHSFVNDNASKLVLGPDGALYGTTREGTKFYFSATADVFRIDSAGTYTPLVTLPIQANSDLVLGSDGAFYGALSFTDCTFADCEWGNLFRVDLGGNLTVYPGRRQGAIPLAVGADGAIWGSVPNLVQCCAFSFRLDPAGSYSELRSLPAPDSLVLGGDDFLYATAGDSVMRFDAAGEVSFPLRGIGSYRLPGPLTVGSDGAIYGVALFGAAFRVDPLGTFVPIPASGASSGLVNQPLTRARSGRLYATEGLDGLIEIVTPDTLSLHRFSPPLRDFRLPAGLYFDALVQGNDCALYGAFDDVVFRLFRRGHLCQSIEFESLEDRRFENESFVVNASASSSLPVSFRASGSCTVTGSEVSLTTGGPCTLTATQPGDSRFEPAPEVARTFDVTFDFTGFLPPVANPPVLNRLTPGQMAPIRFRLGAGAGRGVLAGGSPTVRRVSCQTLEPLGDSVPAHSLLPRAPLHAPGTDRYLYPWRTDSRWAGTCQELTFALVDGTTHTAFFRFRR